MIKKTGIAQAIKKMGTISNLAQEIGVSRQRVSYWRRTGRPAPEYCAAISQATGVPLYKLRPDVYPKEMT